MAKTLFGLVGGPGPRMVAEMRRPQQHVRDLEGELVRLHDGSDALTAGAGQGDVLVLDREPATRST